MGQNYKVVHRPMKLFETVELKSMIRDETILSLALAGPNAIFSCFLPYPVRFDALSVLVVHTKTSEETHFCMNGLMDTISVKICATVTYMCQKQNNTAFRCGSQLALQATYWTGYLSLARTKPLSNHRSAISGANRVSPSRTASWVNAKPRSRTQLGHVTQTQDVSQPPQDCEQGNIGRKFQGVERGGSLVR